MLIFGLLECLSERIDIFFLFYNAAFYFSFISIELLVSYFGFLLVEDGFLAFELLDTIFELIFELIYVYFV